MKATTGGRAYVEYAKNSVTECNTTHYSILQSPFPYPTPKMIITTKKNKSVTSDSLAPLINAVRDFSVKHSAADGVTYITAQGPLNITIVLIASE